MKHTKKSRKFKMLKNVLRGAGIAAVTTVFPACNVFEAGDMYGPPPARNIKGKVLSESTETPIPGISVSSEDSHSNEFTDKNGDFIIRVYRQDEYELKFEDIDGPKNGSFLMKTIKITHEDTNNPLNILLSEAEVKRTDAE